MDTTFFERRLGQLAEEFHAIPGTEKTMRKRVWARMAKMAQPICDQLGQAVIEAARTTPTERPDLYARVRRLAAPLGAIYGTSGVEWIDEQVEKMLDDAVARPVAELDPRHEPWYAVSCRLHGFEPAPLFRRRS